MRYAFWGDLKKGNYGSLQKGNIACIKVKLFFCHESNYQNQFCQKCIDCSALSKNLIQETDVEIRIGNGQIHSYIEENIIGMRRGGSRRFFIPYNEAFEEVGVFDFENKYYIIPSNQHLCFDIHLFEIK